MLPHYLANLGIIYDIYYVRMPSLENIGIQLLFNPTLVCFFY